jgi:AcrR family transcriptional regulator
VSDPTPTAEGPGTLRGKAATQERILAAATDLFLEQGYGGTTMSQVAERAGVSRATVFWHFGEKSGLFREAFGRLLEPVRRSLARSYGGLPADEELEQRIAVYGSFVDEHRQAILGFVRWAMEESDTREWLIAMLFDLHQRFVGSLTETVGRLVPDEADAPSLALGLAVALDGDLFLSFFDPSSRRGDTRRAAVDALVAALPRR